LKYTTLLSYTTPHHKSLALIVCLLLASSVVALANPWMAGQLTQSILAGPSVSSTGFQVILLLWVLLILVRGLLGFATTYVVGSSGATMAAQLRSRVYEHLQILPLTYFQERKQGDTLTLLSNDSEIISNFVTSTLVQLLPLLLTFGGALLIMAWLDSTVALLAVILMPVYYLAMKIIGRKIRPITTQWIESWSGMVALAQENLSLIPTIKAFTREQLESRRFAASNAEVLRLTKRQLLIESALGPAVGFLAGAGLLLLLWVGISHVQTGQLDTPELVSLLLYAILLTQPVSGLANVYGQVMRTRGAAERLLELFAVQPEPFQAGIPEFGRIEGEIEFRNISFSYAGREKVIDKYNLRIAARETVALTGPNGVGKTTLVHLLMRFIDPSEGQILIDGVDIRERDISSLREQIGLVAQNTLLLNGTVMENVSYGIPEASFEDIKKAAKAARAEEFIARLPNGYETLIGDQGIRLSGGQRQRLSLARSLLKNPPILILDEATSMFDPEGEAGFIEECRDIFDQRTVILITHRPASLALADRVLRMEQI
jgi:ATP-binding cassette subfamily B protein